MNCITWREVVGPNHRRTPMIGLVAAAVGLWGAACGAQGPDAGGGFAIVDAGTHAAAEPDVSPAVYVARSTEEGTKAATGVDVPRAGNALRAWDDYRRRALVAIFAGSRPDAGYRIEVQAMSPLEGGEVLSIHGRVTRSDEIAAQVISVPWVVASIDADVATTVQRCVLSLEGESSRQFPCT